MARHDRCLGFHVVHCAWVPQQTCFLSLQFGPLGYGHTRGTRETDETLVSQGRPATMRLGVWLLALLSSPALFAWAAGAGEAKYNHTLALRLVKLSSKPPLFLSL
jgi:hypothetical protein